MNSCSHHLPTQDPRVEHFADVAERAKLAYLTQLIEARNLREQLERERHRHHHCVCHSCGRRHHD